MIHWPQPLIEGRFLARPNRFLILAEVAGATARVRCPSPGRMRELLTPDAPLLLRPRTPPVAPGRWTPCHYDLVLVGHRRRWISVDTQLPNRLFAQHLERGLIPQFATTATFQREVPWGWSRIDFRLNRPRGKPRLVEVKSMNLVIGDLALFPDAPSERASRHLEELMDATLAGFEPWVVFVIQRDDCVACAPYAAADPRFAQAFRQARRCGLKVLGLTHRVTRTGIRLAAQVPVRSHG